MFYFERSSAVLNRVARLSEKVLYDTIKPFKENPPSEQTLPAGKVITEHACDLFSTFTADIIKANMLFIR